MAAIIVSNITSEASEDLARLYSLEATGKFALYINSDLVLVQKVSKSKVVRDWFTDEENPQKRTAAYNELMDFAAMLRNAGMYFGIHNSLNEFSIENETPPEKFLPFKKLDPKNPNDAWYFTCINSDNDYVLEIDKTANEPCLWINHKVMSGTESSEIAGVFCSGLPFDEITYNLFSNYDSKYVKGYIIDRNCVIQMDSSFSGHDFTEGESKIRKLSGNPLFDSAIKSYPENIHKNNNLQTEPVLLKLNEGSFRYVSIVPIAGTDWFVVIFFNNESLFSVKRLLPLIAIMLSAFLLYIFTSRILMRRMVFIPLTNLTNSISKSSVAMQPAMQTAAQTAAENVLSEGSISGLERDDEIGELARGINQMRDDLLQAAKEQERLIRTDQLTNLPNRRYFDERLPVEWERSARTKTQISILMLDLDHFKHYNDTYGHLNGDRVLQAASEIYIQELKRPSDFVVRWGGEEFAVILPDTNLDGAVHIAECIRKQIENKDIILSDGTVTKITVSIGVNTIIPSHNISPSDFIRQADDALYKAKAEGRNQVQTASAM